MRVVAPTATLSGTTTISQGSSTTLQVMLGGVGPWQVKWQDQATPVQVNASPYARLVAPLGTTTYGVTSVTDTYGCSLAVNGTATVTVVPPAPVTTAKAIAANQIRVSWTFTGSADAFEIYRDGTLLAQTALSAGLAPATFTDVSLAGVPAKAVHIAELRTALAAAHAALALPAVQYRRSTLPSGSVIEVTDIREIRGGVQ